MPSSSRPSGAAPVFARAAITVAAAIAAFATTSTGHAQTVPAGEPPAGVDTTPATEAPPAEAPPAGPASAPSTGQAPAAAATAPASQDHQAASAPQRHTARRQPETSSSVATKVNLRRGPSTDTEILATIPAGSSVRVGQCEGEWCAVTWNGHQGWAVERNLNLGGSSSYPGGQRQAGNYPRQPGGPGYDGSPAYGPGGAPAYGPGSGPDLRPGPGYHYGPPEVVGGPGYYYGPRVYYYGRPWRGYYGW